MTEPLGTYTFLPWIRNGIANRITAVSGRRATVPVSLTVNGTKIGGGTESAAVARDVELYGPGDIIGIDTAQISRLEPADWVTNFEPNYLAAIEFYDEDFPWRYTPAAPAGRKLLPWLALVVLEETGEFDEGTGTGQRPLPYIKITAPFGGIFQPADEGWAWAHVHANADFSANVVETDADLASRKAQALISSQPDRACSRLLCPRRLKPRTGYHAFLVPAFESGRLAGLGIEQSGLFDNPANALTPTSSAWGAYATAANRPDPNHFPFYHRWFFRTAEQGDFESLVRLLTPRTVDSRVGHREIDVSQPAPNVSGINDPPFNGVLRMGGALRAPLSVLSPEELAERGTYENWAQPYPHVFQRQLAAFVNLADSYQVQGPSANTDPALDDSVNDDPDPMLTPPAYGRWHALTERLLDASDGTPVPHRENWVHDLNLDPRFRSAAGFGTAMVQKDQETYMEGAWDQIGDVLEANRRIRLAHFALHAGLRTHLRHFRPLASAAPGGLLLLQAPAAARLLSGGVTVRHQVKRSPMSAAMGSVALRRHLRPGGKVARRLGLTDPLDAGEVVTRANAGEITATPDKLPPDGILTPDDLAAAATPPRGVLDRVGDWLFGTPVRWPAWLGVLVLALVLLFAGPVGWALLAVLAVSLLWLWLRHRGRRHPAAVPPLGEDAQVPGMTEQLPESSGFVFTEVPDPRRAPDLPSAPPRGPDNEVAAGFKSALEDQFRVLGLSRALGKVPDKVPLVVDEVARDIVTGLDPARTVPRWTLAGIDIPQRIRDQMGESFVEAMAYPEFDIPMYEPLAKADPDAFVPNIHLVEPDSVTLLETDQRFIEAYLVGLNHEFARELLWREYPTDQRGSYFRQFWDVRKKIAEAPDPAAARERLKDVKPLHLWPGASDLGDHDNREAGTGAEQELVLVVRGELLKKYPNTVISAQPAKWQPKSDGTPDKAKERQLDDSTTPIFPLYEARVAPDIYFFGFDLTAEVARGDDTVDDRPGWFFRIEEVPGDARFGFDVSRAAGTAVNVWNDLSWADVAPGMAEGKPLSVAAIPPRTLEEPLDPSLQEKRVQWEFDRHVPLDAGLSAAELAYIALQTPVIMSVHASQLLRREG
ncbi:hypothetical protein [Streptomyces sp. NPDC046909]|uniref:hypothetical protein n=1 Tax=Streptomyces sp. NPDC046909 TaxID=3155617 RepID=UPI0033E1DCFD